MKFVKRFGQKQEESVTEETTVVETVETKEEAKPAEELNSIGFAMIKWPDNNTFAIATLNFNPATSNAKVEKLEVVGNSRHEAEIEFKTRIGRYFFEQEVKG